MRNARRGSNLFYGSTLNGSGLPRSSPVEVNIVLLLRCYLMHARCLTKWQSVYIVIHVFSISHSVGRCSFLELLKIGLRWRITVRWISQLCIRYHTCFVCPFLCHYFSSGFGCFVSEWAVRGLLLELLNFSSNHDLKFGHFTNLFLVCIQWFRIWSFWT